MKRKFESATGIHCQYNPSVIGKASTAGITLVALVVTIVVLLILAGITIVYVFGDNGVFGQASEAKLKTDIANWQERLEMAKSPVFIEGLGTFNPDKYFDYIQQQGIINNKDTDVIDNGDGTYDVTVKPGYVFLVTLIPTPEKPTDAEIEYIGQTGKLPPRVKSIKVIGKTGTSLDIQVEVVRLEGGKLSYYYKEVEEPESAYKEVKKDVTDLTVTIGNLSDGKIYHIKVVAKNEKGEDELVTVEAIQQLVKTITLDKTTATMKSDDTLQLTATVLPENAENKTLEWSSSNESIATVSNTGLVTAKVAGNVSIIAKATDGSEVTASCNITVKEYTVADIVGQIQTDNRIVKDENGNKVVIPGGFKVIPDISENDVDYTYNGDKKPCVQDGIVIEDDEGNQFVWIPVGSIKNKDGTTTVITLGRYEFNMTNGTPTLKQNATNYSKTVTIQEYFQELISNSENTVAKSLSTFVNKTNTNGGYYIARYEASKGLDGKVDCQGNKATWVNITQSDAAIVAREMYNSNFIESDLINSYSWDTAIVFIQKYSNDSNYANKKSVNLNKKNTGKSGDKVCNIHDMASNCFEWSTEHSTYTKSYNGPCVVRGDYCATSTSTTSSRNYGETTTKTATTSLRTIIYLK